MQLLGHSESWPETGANKTEEREKKVFPFLLSGEEEDSNKSYL